MQTVIRLYSRERSSANRPAPFTLGAPLPIGAVQNAADLLLSDGSGSPAAFQARPLTLWPDGSVRWMLIDFIARVDECFTLSLRRGAIPPETPDPVSVAEYDDRVVMTNGSIGAEAAISADGIIFYGICSGRVKISSAAEIKNKSSETNITSRTVIDRVEVYEPGPVRAAVSITGRRVYTDGSEGPFSQRLTMYAGCRYIKLEDTFVYSHLPGTHAEPDNKLAFWGLNCDGKIDARPFIGPEESEGLAVSDTGVAFWGVDTPFDFSRNTDEELVGEDSPGIALGVAKTCAALFSFPADGPDGVVLLHGSFAYVKPEAYACALADFSAIDNEKFEAVEEGVKQILGFWLWFQDNDPVGYDGRGPWHGLFDWGDWQVRYSNSESEPVGWQYFEGRYGWDCGEMDTSLMLWNIFLHTGDEKYIRPAVAMARHAADVDTIHVDYRKYAPPDYIYDGHCYDAPWREGADRLYNLDTRGLGRRHNVQHWGNGVGDTRHSFNAGVAMHYLLTGDRRARDCALSIADMHMTRLYGYASGEYSLAMECLYWAYKISGDKKYLTEFEYRLGVIRELQFSDGSIPEHIDFDARTDYKDVDGDAGAHASLTLDYISNALAEYHFDTGDTAAAEVLLALAECAHKKNPPNHGLSYPDLSDLRALAWAYKHTGDKKFYDRLFYLTFTLAAQPLDKTPETADEWVRMTYNVMWRQRWRIRHIGPGVRMVPYALSVL